jgi:hypothetical protein
MDRDANNIGICLLAMGHDWRSAWQYAEDQLQPLDRVIPDRWSVAQLNPGDVVESGTAYHGTCATCERDTVVARVADVQGALCADCATAEGRDMVRQGIASAAFDCLTMAVACRRFVEGRG